MIYFRKMVEGTWTRGEEIDLPDAKAVAHPQVTLPESTDIIADLENRSRIQISSLFSEGDLISDLNFFLLEIIKNTEKKLSGGE